MNPQPRARRALAAATTFCAAILFSTTLATAQDECSTAVTIIDGTNGPFDMLAATPSPQPHRCANGNDLDLWFRYVVNCCGNFTVDNCTPAFSMDTSIEVYDGTAGCGNLRSLDCQGQSCSYQARVTVPVIPGQVLYIRVCTYATGYASNLFFLHAGCVPSTPFNDEATAALAIVQGQNGPYRSYCSTLSAQPWPCASVSGDVWFSYQATASGPFTFRTCGSTYDTAMQLFDGSAGPGNLVSMGCNDDFCGFQSSVTGTLSSGATYYLRVGGVSGSAAGSEGMISLEAWPGDGTRTVVVGAPGCGATTINVGGNPYHGSSLFVQLGNTTGPSFIGLGFGPYPSAQFCGCYVGHSWQVVSFGTTANIGLPNNPSLVGVQFGLQGADFGGTGGCTAPNFTLSSTRQVIIG